MIQCSITTQTREYVLIASIYNIWLSLIEMSTDEEKVFRVHGGSWWLELWRQLILNNFIRWSSQILTGMASLNKACHQHAKNVCLVSWKKTCKKLSLHLTMIHEVIYWLNVRFSEFNSIWLRANTFLNFLILTGSWWVLVNSNVSWFSEIQC